MTPAEALERVRALHFREVIAVHESHGEEAWCPKCQEHWPCQTVSILDAVIPERTEQEREAAVERVADLLAEHMLGETWGDDGITFVGCDCGEWFGRALDDAHEAGRMHIARAAIAAYEGREVSE